MKLPSISLRKGPRLAAPAASGPAVAAPTKPSRIAPPVPRLTLAQFAREIQSPDFKNVGRWPWQVQAFWIGLLAIVIVAAGWYFLVSPDQDTLAGEQAKEVTLRDDFEKKQKKVAGLDAYKEQLKEMERTFGDMLKQLPSKTEVASLLNDISQTRVASGLEEELFQPLPEVPKTFYAELPNKIIVTGEYHNMGEFVSGVAALPRIVVIDEIDIRPIGGTAAQNQLRMNAVAKTYRYLDEEEQAANQPKDANGKPLPPAPAGGAK